MKRKRWSLVVLALAIALWAWVSLSARRSPEQLSEIRAALDNGATLVDVRTAEEYRSGHLPGAINVPVGTLSRGTAAIPSSQPVVVYCHSGSRSASAAVMLQRQGYPKVFDLGGIGNGPAVGK